jgi:hypothetical protein
MILWNLLDGGPSSKGHLFRPFESLRGGILGTNPRQPRRRAISIFCSDASLYSHVVLLIPIPIITIVRFILVERYLSILIYSF